jgi:hypothetical protein
VLLAYLDESDSPKRYFVAGVLVPDTEARSLTAALDGVVEEASYEDGRIASSAELHGHEIVNATKAWKRLKPDIAARIEVYNNALQAVADHDVTIIIRSVDKIRLDKRYPDGHDHPHLVGLTHLIERVDEYAERVGQNALLIADEVAEQDSYRRDLWQYQRSATWGYRQRQIMRVIDTLHFALLRSAITRPNPTIFLEHKALYNIKGPVERTPVPLGKAQVIRAGEHLTVVATQLLLHRALTIAERLEHQDISVEVIDPRTLYPLDLQTITTSVAKTHRLLIAHEAPRDFGFGAEIAASITETCWEILDYPPVRVAGARTPIPYAGKLESEVIPDEADLEAAIAHMITGNAAPQRRTAGA